MLFLVLVLVSILLAWAQRRGWWARDLTTARAALILGGSAHLARWLVEAVVVRAASVASSSSVAAWIVTAQGIALAVLGLLTWTALGRLVFRYVHRRDLLWVIPVGTLSVLIAASGSVATGAILAAPILWRSQWRREISSGTTALVSLFGALLLLLGVFSTRLSSADAGGPAFAVQFERYAGWTGGLAMVHVLLALPRLLWGVHLPIRSVRRRLLISHALTGIVPIALVLVFWGLSSYLSVTTERAQAAARLLREEAADLGAILESALRDPEGAETSLRHWGRLHAAGAPGLRVYVGSDSLPGSLRGRSLARLLGEPIEQEAALLILPDSLAEGVFLLGGEPYLGAQRILRAERAPAGGEAPPGEPGMPARPPAGGDSPVPADVVDTVPGNRVGLILVPIRDRLGQSLRRRIDCEVVVESIPAGVTGRPGPESVLLPGESRRSAGVALLRAQAWTEGQWKERPVLLWAQVGFLYTIRGVASNVRENPSNIMALIFLAVVALLFVLVEILTLGLVTAMGRSILRALNSLRQGTARLRSGNLRYRIPIEGRDDLWDVAESFNQMAEDLSRARELEIEKERMEGELAIARSIQSRLLPAESPTFPRADLAGLSLPAREVGGDYYDVLKLSDHEVGLIVADVSGKGVGAALLMSSFRAALLSQDLRVHGPAVTMQRINGFLHRSIEPGRFVTAFLCVLDVGRGRISYANAGHNQPLLVRATGEISMLREGGLVLGMFGDTPYRQVDIDVDPGDLLVLYTDGLTEAVNEEEEFYGEERLIDCLRRHPQVSCRDALRSIMTEVRAFTEGTGLPDDLTVLLARWRGADPGKLSSELPYEAERRASHVGRI